MCIRDSACALRRLPAAIRQWWTKAEHKISAVVEKVTTLFVSPSLSAEEIRGVKQEKKFDNMTVSVTVILKAYLTLEVKEKYRIKKCSECICCSYCNLCCCTYCRIYAFFQIIFFL